MRQEEPTLAQQTKEA